MITKQQIKKKVLENEALIYNDYYQGNNFYGFWDLHKSKLVLRVFGGKTLPKTKEFIYFQEVLRYYPENHRQRVKYYSRYYGSVNKMIQTRIWCTDNLQEPYGCRFYFRTTYDNGDKALINIRLNKKNMPYKTYLSYMSERPKESNWGYYTKENEKYVKVNYKEITEYILTENQLNKIKEYRIKELKINQSILDLIDRDKIHTISELANYIDLYKKYTGLKFLYKNYLSRQLKEPFLQEIDRNKELHKHFINLFKKDEDLARSLNARELKLHYKGVDVKERRKQINFKSNLTKVLKETWGTEKNEKNKEVLKIDTNRKKEIHKILIDNIFELPIYKEIKNLYFYNSDLRHYIDYLELKHLINNKLTNAMIFNKKWRQELDLHKEQLKEEENRKITNKIKEIADMLGIKESKLKKGKEKNKYLFKVPETIKEYNQHGKELNHCYRGNSIYLEKHTEMKRVLIFIEKDGKPFATATLHDDGKVTQVHQHNNKEVEKDLKTKFNKIIRETFLPKITEMRGETYGN